MLVDSVRMISSVLRIITGSKPRKFVAVAVYNAPSARDKKQEKDDVETIGTKSTLVDSCI